MTQDARHWVGFLAQHVRYHWGAIHLRSNYDRTGFQQDLNVVLPLDRLRELAAEGVIGSVADYNYSFMGAAPIRQLEPRARQLAGLLKQDQVDAVLLSPV